MTLHVAVVGRVTIHEPSHVLGCELVRGIGYSWTCRCKERGHVRRTYREASSDARADVAQAAQALGGRARDGADAMADTHGLDISEQARAELRH